MPLVSIIIPAYNAESYLTDALESCFKQTHPDCEIIVVDDGSSDQTAAIARSYPQVTYLYQPNAGPSAARNRGIAAAKGEFIQFLDADDVLLPDKITRCLAEFEAHPVAGLVYSDYELHSADLQSPAQGITKPPSSVPQERIVSYLLESATTFFASSCPLIARSSLAEDQPFDERLSVAEDWMLWIKLGLHGVRFHHIPEVLVWVRVTPNSLTKDGVRVARERLKAYELLREVHLPPKFALEAKIAGRHHALGVRLWEQGQRGAAREQFRQALACGSGRGSRFMLWASYFLSAQQADRLLQRLRRRR